MEIYNYLILYLLLISITISYSFIRQRTYNNIQKFVRLINLFVFMPAKMLLILLSFYLIHFLLSKIFFMVFEQTNQNFPSVLLYFFNYGLFIMLCVYSFFGQQIFSLFIIFFILTIVLSYSLTKSLGYTFFPYKIKNLTIWNWLLAFLYIFLIFLGIIPFTFVLVQIYMIDFGEVV